MEKNINSHLNIILLYIYFKFVPYGIPSFWPARSLLGGVAQTYEFGLKFFFSCLKITEFLKFFFLMENQLRKIEGHLCYGCPDPDGKERVKVALGGRDGNAPF